MAYCPSCDKSIKSDPGLRCPVCDAALQAKKIVTPKPRPKPKAKAKAKTSKKKG